MAGSSKRRDFRNPVPGGQRVAIGFDVDDAVYAQLQCIAEEREWTLSHVLRKLIPWGLDAYLKRTTLGRMDFSCEEVPGDE